MLEVLQRNPEPHRLPGEDMVRHPNIELKPRQDQPRDEPGQQHSRQQATEHEIQEVVAGERRGAGDHDDHEGVEDPFARQAIAPGKMGPAIKNPLGNVRIREVDDIGTDSQRHQAQGDADRQIPQAIDLQGSQRKRDRNQQPGGCLPKSGLGILRGHDAGPLLFSLEADLLLFSLIDGLHWNSAARGNRQRAPPLAAQPRSGALILARGGAKRNPG